MRPQANTPRQPGYPHLAGVDVDANLGELCPERVPRHRRAVVLVVRSVNGDLRLAGPQRAAGLDHRRAPGRGAHRPARHHRLAEGAVADLDVHPLRRDVQLVRRDLGQHRPRAGADVGSGDADGEAAVVLGPAGGRGRHAAGRVGRCGDAQAGQPAAVAARRGPRVAPRPAGTLRALAQARDQVARGERVAALRVDVGLVADPQLDRIHVEGDRELVDRRLQGEHPRAFARRPHPGRRRDVERDHPVGRPAGGRRVHHPGRRLRSAPRTPAPARSARRRRARCRPGCRPAPLPAGGAGSSASGSRSA